MAEHKAHMSWCIDASLLAAAAIGVLFLLFVRFMLYFGRGTACHEQ